ncbi:hypothetical protein DY000_02040004 [Brassica cretica]|uniref:Ubiquitin-like protease family profile domain-containing protein n=1 Tax=Brassica cretica TaxID=69181 RepID=A0ABQ7BDD6_BRACR|nr:hypothetical protein DY000_02040004 [Brassica cretica]
MRWIKDLERWKLLVKEAKEKSASTKDGEPPLVEQESKEGATTSTACGEATRKRNASDDVNQTFIVAFHLPLTTSSLALTPKIQRPHGLSLLKSAKKDSDGSTWSELDPTAICNLWIVTSLTLGYAYVVSRFIGTYCKLYVHASSGHSDDLQMIECGETRANSASSELPPEPFVVPSFMGPATEKGGGSRASHLGSIFRHGFIFCSSSPIPDLLFISTLPAISAKFIRLVFDIANWEDQIRLCYLAILTGGLLALDRREAIPPAKAKLLMDLEIFEQYPWRRVAFVELVQQIKDATATKIKDDSYVCKGFVQVIQYGKLPLGSILEKAKVTCMSPRSVDEVHPVWEQEDEDPEIDNLLEFLRQDNSLSTITWQALPEYPLTPIECNKRRRVASQWKSKKSKKVASNEQENIADGSEKRGDIAETEEQVQIDDGDGNFFIQWRKNPERLFHMEPPHVGTLGNLVSRVAALERNGCEVEKFVDLVSRVLSLEEDWRVPNTRVKLSVCQSTTIQAICCDVILVDKEKVRALNAFIKEKGDSTYPPGNVFTAKEFFQTFMKPRSWLSFVDLDVPLAMYRVRFSQNPTDFISPRIIILDAVFQTWWSSQYKEWLGDQSNIPKGVYDYYRENSHWVMMVISIPDRTIEIYDSMTGLIPMEIITQAAIPFVRMVPYVLYACSDPEVKQVMDTTMYSIQFVTDGVPQIKPPYGDCGIYAVKFIECLVMGVAFADEHLRKPFLRNASPASFKEFFSIVNFIVLFTSASYSSLFQGNTCFGNFYHKPYQAMPVQASLPRTRKPCFLKPVLLPSKLFVLLTGEYYGVPSQFVF